MLANVILPVSVKFSLYTFSDRHLIKLSNSELLSLTRISVQYWIFKISEMNLYDNNQLGSEVAYEVF